MLTRPKLRDPFQETRIDGRSVERTDRILLLARDSYLGIMAMVPTALLGAQPTARPHPNSEPTI